ncbi:cytochrome c oxidase subunit 4 isoform 1, mitochondrial [Bacillus rossius redtenbacheri]|uniref:cytochrome c oxidase subunit 4 isoform 1, mitochondrial n=1 Tax=Bacillus rossius redtenbacheri TaxID=93214 RepID=UPI002FDDB0E5
MAGRLLSQSLLRKIQHIQKFGIHNRSRIGSREIVGYGFNGQASYIDRSDFPMPAVRFRENTPDVQVLREKEKGDWNKLTLEEKKALYRASFCLTFAEMHAPTGEWKSIIGITLLLMSAGIWAYILEKLFVYPELPESFSVERKQAQLKRLIDMQANPIEGLASKWDYENNKWK